MPTLTPKEEVAALIRELDEHFYRSSELVGQLRNLVRNDHSDDAYVLREAADHIAGMYQRAKELRKLLPKLMAE